MGGDRRCEEDEQAEEWTTFHAIPWTSCPASSHRIVNKKRLRRRNRRRPQPKGSGCGRHTNRINLARRMRRFGQSAISAGHCAGGFLRSSMNLAYLTPIALLAVSNIFM